MSVRLLVKKLLENCDELDIKKTFFKVFEQITFLTTTFLTPKKIEENTLGCKQFMTKDLLTEMVLMI